MDIIIIDYLDKIKIEVLIRQNSTQISQRELNFQS